MRVPSVGRLTKEAIMSDEDHKQVEEDAKEDLELSDEDADKVGGGGSATGGAGAGKVKFNEFTITKTTDQASP